MTEDIRMMISERRRADLKTLGPTLGAQVPYTRRVPLVSTETIVHNLSLILEVKRSSPSKGIIDENLDAVRQAGIYLSQGASVVSVLTEGHWFGGSLEDLMAVKEAYGNLAVLRKDFLLCKEDIEVSYAAGADLVLLIASLVDQSTLSSLYHLAISYGMTPIVEVHDRADIEKARPLEPLLTGINSRDLRSFRIDRLLPLQVKEELGYSGRCIYESGITGFESAHFASSHGFDALLIGESAVRDVSSISTIARGFAAGKTLVRKGDLFSRIATMRRIKRPLVKICGITREEDAVLAVESGADLLGFVFADSPRRCPEGLPERLQRLSVLKVAVIVTTDTDSADVIRVKELYASGLIDAIQVHGEPDKRFDTLPVYRALTIRQESDLERADLQVRVLLDAHHPDRSGRGRHRIDQLILQRASELMPLWIAGGIDEQNIVELVERFNPELVDVSSSVESRPGIKDPERLKGFFRTLKEARV